MNLGGVMKNPVVWGGGALIGVVMLLRSGGANANVASNMNAVNPTVMSGAVQMNAAAMGAQIQMAGITADLTKAKYAADVTDHANVLAYMKAIDDNQTVLATQRAESNAGVTNSLIASSAAIIIDQSNNAARLGQSYFEYATAVANDKANVDITKLQTSAAKAISHNSLLGTIAGSIAKVATVGISAATGMPLPGMGF